MEQTSRTLGLLGKAQLQCKDHNSPEVLNCSHPSYQSQAGAPYPMVIMLGQLLWRILAMETCIMTYRLVMESTKHFITNILCCIRSTFFCGASLECTQQLFVHPIATELWSVTLSGYSQHHIHILPMMHTFLDGIKPSHILPMLHFLPRLFLRCKQSW